MNLLNNACDAVADVPAPAIRCSLSEFKADEQFRQKHSDLKQDEFACITVADNGHGIESEYIEKIFEPFFTTKEVGKRTGLGLAMIYGAIQSHGGIIEVESEVNTGTEFRLYLPLCMHAPETETNTEMTDLKGHGETILLVDDEESVRSTTSEVLTSMGYQVYEACDGEEALELFKTKSEEIDLIISDVIMPKMGGIDLLNHVHKLNETVPIILATGYDKGHVMELGLTADSCQMINKPFDFNTLSRVIQQLISHK